MPTNLRNSLISGFVLLEFFFLPAIPSVSLGQTNVLGKSSGDNGTLGAFLNKGIANGKGNSAAVQPDGKIVIAGYSHSTSGYAFAIVRYNADGTLDDTFGKNGAATTPIGGGDGTDDEAESVAIQPDGKIVVAGFSKDASNNYAFAVARFNTNGKLDNSFGTNGTVRTFISVGDSSYDKGYSISIRSDTEIVVGGYSAVVDTNYVSCVALFNENGQVASTTQSRSSGTYKVQTLSKEGAVRVNEEVISEAALPKDYDLYQNFPNPFNPSTMINYQLPMNSFVNLKVYDALGKEIATLVNKVQSPGSYTVTFDASRLPSGVYFYQITAGSYTKVRKMVVTK